MTPSNEDREAATARQTRIEGVLAAMAFSAIVGYLLGWKGIPLTVSAGAYYAAIIAVFFGVLYVVGGAIVISARAAWRLISGAWRYGASDRRSGASGASLAGLNEGLALLRADVDTLKGNADELLGYARLDGGRIAELHMAFVAARAERQKR